MSLLPTLLVIGAAKAGTTSLHRCLGQHPEIHMSPVKEPNFFALSGRPADFRGPRDPERINRWSVSRLADYQALFEPGSGRLARGESSVAYLYAANAPAAIHDLVPDVKLVAVLRDPAERAWSTYLYMVLNGLEPAGTFEEALRLEPSRIEAGWQHIWHYRRMGFYHEQLARYFARFPKEQIRVYLYDDFCEDPRGLLADLFRFLGVDDRFEPRLGSRENASAMPRHRALHEFLNGRSAAKRWLQQAIPAPWRARVSRVMHRWNLVRPPLDPDVRARLVREYRSDILRLENLIGRDLAAWLAVPAGETGTLQHD